MDSASYLQTFLRSGTDNVSLSAYFEEVDATFNPKAFVISRAKDGDRWDHAFSLLSELGMQPLKFLAVEGAAEQQRFNGYSKLNPGELGCLLSHMSILQAAALHSNPNQYTLVFEDDIISTLRGEASYRTHFDALKRHLMPEIRMVYQGKCLEQCLCMEPVGDGLFKASQPSCTHAYMIKNSAAREIMVAGGLQHSAFLGLPIDQGYRNLIQSKQFSALVFHPALFFQEVMQQASALREGSAQMYNYLECVEMQKSSMHHFFQTACSSPVSATALVLFTVAVLCVLFFAFRRRSATTRK